MKKCDLYAKFIDKYSGLVYTAIDRRLKSCGFNLPRDEIMDIRQDVLSSIYESNGLSGVRNRESIPYWIAIVSGNAAMQHVRRRRRHEGDNMVSLSGGDCSDEFAEGIPCPNPIPSDEIHRNELSAKIDSAIRSLPARERLIAKLHLIKGKRYAEIADMLKIPIGTVCSHVKRAKERLKIHLKDFEGLQ